MNEQFLTAAVTKMADDGGAWTAVASRPSIDRDDEVIEAGAFQPLPAKVPVHDRHGGELIGSARPYYVGPDLMVDGRFATTPKAQIVRQLVRESHLETMSVVFMPLKDRSVDGRRHITKGELLAVDWAPISSNRDARVLAVRSYEGSDDFMDWVWKEVRAAERVLVDLALDDAKHVLTEVKAADSPVTKDSVRRALAEANEFLNDLKGRP